MKQRYSNRPHGLILWQGITMHPLLITRNAWWNHVEALLILLHLSFISLLAVKLGGEGLKQLKKWQKNWSLALKGDVFFALGKECSLGGINWNDPARIS